MCRTFDGAFGTFASLGSRVRSRTTTFQSLLLLLVGVWTASCGTSGEPETRFEVLLRIVERLSEAGVVTAIPVEELSSANRARGYTVGRFTDGGLHFGVDFLSSQIQFEITNRSGAPVTIPWDSTVYLDADGNEHRGYSSREQRKSAIGPGKRLLVLGAPTDFTTPVDNGFALTGILQPPPSVDPVLQKSRDLYCSQIGKELTVRLPVSVNDELRIYSMHFEITDIFVIEFRSGHRGDENDGTGAAEIRHACPVPHGKSIETCPSYGFRA